MSLIVAFQMEPMEEVDMQWSSTLMLMEEAHARGHTIYQYAPSQLTLTEHNVIARAHKVFLKPGKKPFYRLGKDELINLTSVDVVMMRQDPPFNMEYVTATYLLEAIKSKVLVVNDPVAVRNLPEKIFPFVVPDFIPPTIITEDIEAVKIFYKQYKDIVLKPLYLFGGTDVFRFKKGEKTKLESRFAQLLKKHKAPVVVQRFIPEVSQGDKRIILVDGEVVCAILKVPKAGSILANHSAGGALKKTQLTARDKKICAALAPILKAYGFLICSLDVIGPYLTEVNVTSPAGFRQAEFLYGVNLTTPVWKTIEARVKEKKRGLVS